MRAVADPPRGAPPRRLPGPPVPSVTEELRSILRNSSVLIGAQVLASIVSMVLMVLLSRALGDAEFGRLHLALSLTMIVGVVAEFGLAQVLARAVARDPARARPYVRRSLAVVAALAVVVYAGLLGLVSRLGYSDDVHRLVAILGVLVLAEAMSQLLSALFQAHERMQVPALARVAGNAFTLAGVLPLVSLGYGAGAVATVMVVAAFVRVGIQAACARRLSGLRAASGASPRGAQLLLAGLPFLLAQVLGMIVFRIDVVMLGRLTSDATVGWYGAASRLMEAFNFLPQMLTAATFPVAARLWITAPSEFRVTMRKTLRLLLVVTVPVSVVLLVDAEAIVGLLFTLERYGPAVPILRIHALSLALVFLDFYLAGILMAVGRERAWTGILAVAAVLNPALNWLLIPLTDGRLGNGGIGAAGATFATEMVVFWLAVRTVPAGAFGRDSARLAGQMLGVGVLLAGVLLGGRAFGVPWVPAVTAAGLGYLALVVRLGLVPPDVTGWARAAITRRGRALAA